MAMKRKSIIMVTMLLMLAGCEKVIEIDVDRTEPLVVVNGDMRADSAATVRLTYSKFFLDESAFREITDAEVTLSVNGGNGLTPSGREGGNYRFAYRPSEGDTVRLRVAVPGKGEATAQTVVPVAAQVHGFRVTKISPRDGGQRYQVRFTLDDDASRTDYYAIRLMADRTYYRRWQVGDSVVYDTAHYSERLPFSCVDYDLIGQNDAWDNIEGDETQYWQLLFDDGAINGQSREVVLTTASYLGEEDYGHSEYRIEVITFSRERYLYEKSLEALDDDMGIFSEPVQIHTNITGGIGLFAARNIRTFKIEQE